MPRRLRIETKELGFLELYLIYQYGDSWEPEWIELQHDQVLVPLFTQTTKEVWDHALHGWTRPFVTALQLAPHEILRKIPRHCALRRGCVFHNPVDCHAVAKKTPLCFEVSGVQSGSDLQRTLAREIIRMWREGVYIIVVQEPAHG